MILIPNGERPPDAVAPGLDHHADLDLTTRSQAALEVSQEPCVGVAPALVQRAMLSLRECLSIEAENDPDAAVPQEIQPARVAAASY